MKKLSRVTWLSPVKSQAFLKAKDASLLGLVEKYDMGKSQL